MLVIVGASNAVNLTDGLDGLAIGPIMLTAVCFGIISYLVGNAVFCRLPANSFRQGYRRTGGLLRGADGRWPRLFVVQRPARRSLYGRYRVAINGGSLGALAVITKHEIVLAIIGGLFVMETLSVIIQVVYFKATGGKRFFQMAPIHHHFEKKGWPETKVVVRFWIISLIFALIGLSTLKLR